MSQQLSDYSLLPEWLKIDLLNITDSFDRIANHLFNEYLIKVNQCCYRILEIEFYYNHEKEHHDAYTHGNPKQKTLGKWYFHYSGIDITCGNENAYGGILIRSVEQVEPKPVSVKERFIIGPLKTQMKLLNGIKDAFGEQPSSFQLIPEARRISRVDEKNIVRCRRIGLKEYPGEKGREYHQHPYRYLIFPKLNYKDRPGIEAALKNHLV